MRDVSWPLVGTPEPEAGVPTTVGHACTLVGQDLLTESAIAGRFPQLRWTAEPHPLGVADTLLLGLTGADMSFAFDLELTLPTPNLIAALADRVQTHFTGYEFITWPLCWVQGHQHPMTATVTLDERASWVCPSTGTVVSLIGELTTDC
ncbi:hypothetical protein LI90_2449 [Carbonactinospora thermoautotrophica]|uniref:Uncharacterized protein n=1 Tax=Carbonactinospora thermoautotrophica TaxID=1469144 RepID=A0A132MUA0_9ACTN|nr:hypothetical protein [Carbonactinospora thermoautotrophica]KWX01421.1 hypothetical protein LI90_2449 [Carbonactinospora thermoautotrophica]